MRLMSYSIFYVIKFFPKNIATYFYVTWMNSVVATALTSCAYVEFYLLRDAPNALLYFCVKHKIFS